MKTLAIFSFLTIIAFLLVLVSVVNPPSAKAVPSFARQTGLPCSACHYTPPELNPAGRRFKLLGYVDKADDAKTVHSDSGKSHAALDLLASLPLSAMLETSYTQTRKAVPATQNGTLEFPQDVSLFISGAWTTHVGSFIQLTYNVQDDHFSMDNSDVRYANIGKLDGKELIYGLDLNNNPTVEDLWNDGPAWGFPWIADDFAPTPNASPIVNGNLGQDVAGFGAYAMWDNHLYLDSAFYRSDHIGLGQPNQGVGFTYNIRGVAPYWRVAWQESSGTTQFEIGSYGMHMRSTPNSVVGPEDSYTDWAVDTQYDRTIHRIDVLSLRATYIRESSDLAALFADGAATQRTHDLGTLLANAEYHFGNRFTTAVGWFNTSGTADGLLYPTGDVTGNFNGDPKNNGYIFSTSYWPWQNVQLGAQYTAYMRFNGAATNYDGAGRNASDNDTFYLVGRFLF